MSNTKTEISNCNLCGEVIGELIFLGQKISSKCKECERIVCIKCVGCLRTSNNWEDNNNTVCQYCLFSEYDFKVYKSPGALPSRDFIEIGPDNSECWAEGNIYIKDESFALLSEIIDKTLAGYNHYVFNDYSRKDILKLIDIFNRLIESDDKELQAAINLNDLIFQTYKGDIVGMIKDISNALVKFCKTSEHIKILGI